MNATDRLAMEAELASVLSDRTFLRSPVLTRLLTFLVESTLSGGTKPLKSYSVAVEGLGRNAEPDPQTDTYARVQVTRLRKALDAFYAAAGKKHSSRLTIDSGSYEVRLTEHCPASSAQEPSRVRPAFLSASALSVLLGASILLAIGIALAFYWRAGSREQLLQWRAANFPSVSVTVANQGPGPLRAGLADLMRQHLLMRIGRYQGVRVQYDGSARATYGIEVKLIQSGPDLIANSFVVDLRNRRLIWSSSNVVQSSADESSLSESEYVSQTAFSVAHAAGVIHTAERQLSHRVDTPYDCWLRFAMQVQDRRFTEDSGLRRCAQEWHDASPQDPMAAGLYSWTLLDQSVVAFTDSQREELIGRAIETLEGARTMNPDSGFLPAVATRAYALADEDPAMRTAADEALRLNPGNLEIQGLIGTMLLFRRDPRGEALLDDAISHRSNPPPWYFLAKFLAAMRREDTVGAHRALERLRHLDHFLPLVPICTAAYEARIGKVDRARAHWEQAKRLRPILRINPDVFFERTPLDSRTAAQLKRWLAPALR